MSVMLILLGASLIVSLIFLAAFIWSVRDGQYDDDYSPAHKIFFDETPKSKI
ncbi:MAG: cbb3-type cytochrome oxidase assembly protein CcoS [Ginsengibacter sp.]